jgi:hypothetical protein
MMTRITRRIAIGVVALGLAGTAIASRGPYRAICSEWLCRWSGAPRHDLGEALLDARDHWSSTRHHVRIEGLPLDPPFPLGQASSGPRG